MKIPTPSLKNMKEGHICEKIVEIHWEIYVL